MDMSTLYLLIIACAILIWYLFFKHKVNRIPAINEAFKTCIVTGASSGIGSEIAQQMVSRGWTVVGVARRYEKLLELERKLGPLFIPYKCDVSNTQEISELCEKLKQQQLKPTLFFLNAGIGEVEISYEPMLNVHKQTFETNYFGIIRWIDEWIYEAKKLGGATFVATSSMTSLFAGPRMGGYGASKAAINACFRSLRLQYLQDNIGFVIVMPGPVRTAMLKHFDAKGSIINLKLPFIHEPNAEARYIVKHVFKRQKHIEPSLFYSCLLRIFNVLPDRLVLKIISWILNK